MSSLTLQTDAHPQSLVQADLVLLRFALLRFTDIVVFPQMEGLWQPCIKQVYWRRFSNSICSLHVSVSLLVILAIAQTFSLLLYLLCDQ